jgi:hypothetical protein
LRILANARLTLHFCLLAASKIKKNEEKRSASTQLRLRLLRAQINELSDTLAYLHLWLRVRVESNKKQIDIHAAYSATFTRIDKTISATHFHRRTFTISDFFRDVATTSLKTLDFDC